MRLTIFNFRAVRNRVMEFPDLGSVLISGDNGVGKTTSFCAFDWCLYGAMSDVSDDKAINKPVRMHGKIKDEERVHVSIETKHITINRYKTPDQLSVIMNETEYKDADAQAIIVKVFGTREVWTSCSYSAQASRHTLIDSKAADKHKLIYDLTFGDPDTTKLDPNHFIQETKNKMKVVHDELIETETLVNLYSTDDVKGLSDKCTVESTLEEIDGVNRKLGMNTVAMEMERAKYTAHKTARDKRLYILNKKDELNRDREVCVGKLKDVLEPLDEMKKTLIATNESLDVNKNIQAVNAKMLTFNMNEDLVTQLFETQNDELVALIDKYAHVSLVNGVTLGALPNHVENLVKAHSAYHEHTTLVKKIDSEHADACKDVELHNRTIDVKIGGIVNHNTRMSMLRDKKRMFDKYKESLSRIIEPNRDSYDSHQEVKDRLAVIKEKLKEHSCPRCGSGLVVVKNRLQVGVVTTQIKEQLKEERAKLLKLNDEWTEYSLAQKVSSSLKVEPIEEVIADDLSTVELEKEKRTMPIKKDVPKLGMSISDIAVIKKQDSDSMSLIKSIPSELDFNPILMNMSLIKLKKMMSNKDGWNYVNEELQVLLSKKSPEPASTLMLRKSVLEMNINIIEKNTQRMQNIDVQSASYDRDLQDIKMITDEDIALSQREITRLKDVDQELMNDVAMLDEQMMLVKNRDALVTACERRDALFKRHVSLDKFMKLIDTLSHDSMEAVVKSIQDQTNKVLETIFEDDLEGMSLTLSTEKTTKDGKKTKFAIDTKIHYKGKTYSKCNTLSGGEVSILTLALILGMAQTNHTSFLLLDESFSAISMNKRDKCMDAIKKFASDKCIVSILHGAEDDMYDTVIKLS